MNNTLEKLALPWEVISLIGLDKIAPKNMHLYNAVLYGLADRYNQYGFEWVKEHAQEIRTQICAASRYAGDCLCDGLEGCECWGQACTDAARLLDAADSPDVPDAAHTSAPAGDSDATGSEEESADDAADTTDSV